jgi:hypothetical protein
LAQDGIYQVQADFQTLLACFNELGIIVAFAFPEETKLVWITSMKKTIFSSNSPAVKPKVIPIKVQSLNK